MENCSIPIKRRKGIDGLVSGYSPEKVEEENDLLCTGNKYDRLLIKYSTYLSIPFCPHDNSRMEAVLRTVDEVLQPEELDTLLQVTCRSQHEKHFHRRTGQFFSRLINNSYLAGYNNFSFHMTELIEMFCFNVRGTEENRPPGRGSIRLPG